MNIENYLDLITSEHSDKPKFSALVETICAPLVSVQNSFAGMPLDYDLNNAVGAQLDVIGQWVGISRYLLEPVVGVFFGFDLDGLGFDQGVWEGPFNPSTYLVALPDDHYRLLLNSRIFNNQWDGSKRMAKTISTLAFGPLGYEIILQDNADMSMNLGIIGTTITPTTLAISMLTQKVLNVKPATVRISAFFHASIEGPIFGFDINNEYFSGFDTSGWAILINN